MDEPVDHQSLRADNKERRRPSLTIGERLRRGMTGEMNTDLQNLLQKAKPVIQKSEATLGSSSGVDLTQVLLRFLHDRIGAVV
jgi:nuclear pore complex protein Nup188